MRPRNRAFTLVELLVVIGIISVLISVLLPALARARDSANAIACASNLRQIGMAIQLYAQESKGVLPMGEPFPNTTAWGRWTTMLVGPGYLKGAGQTTSRYSIARAGAVWGCPSDPTFQLGAAIIFEGGAQSHNFSWLPNSRVMPWATHYIDTTAARITRIRRPSDRLVLTERDALGFTASGGNNGGVPIGLIPAWNVQRIIDRVSGRHGQQKAGRFDRSMAMANVLFLDGHVNLMFVKEIVRPARRAEAGDPNPDPQGLWGLEVWR